MPLIPFKYMPSSWGLKGKSRDRAEAEYSLKDEELARRLADIDLLGTIAFDQEMIAIDLKYGHIDKLAYETALAKIMHVSETDQKLALLDIDLRHSKITELHYAKETATLKDEPWVHGELKKDDNGHYFDFDWNDIFIAELRQKGFTAEADEDVINMWLERNMQEIGMEMFNDPTIL